MVMRFGRYAEMGTVNVSMILDPSHLTSKDAKYRAACIMEILTLQRPRVEECSMEVMDPVVMQYEKQEMQNYRVKMSSFGSKSRPMGLRATTDLHRSNKWAFLEKLREFYLPDVTGDDNIVDSSKILEREKLVQCFQRRNPSTLPGRPPYLPLRSAKDNPKIFYSTFILKSTNLLRFPDFEVFFEAIGKMISTEVVNIYVTPEIKIVSPKPSISHELPAIDNLKLGNFLLSNLINPYIERHRVTPLKDKRIDAEHKELEFIP